MADRLAVLDGSEYVYPGFARWGMGLARTATQMLMSDPSNPTANQPELWAQSSGLIRVVTRALTYDALATGTNSTSDFRPTNGKNFIIFARTAVATRDAGTVSDNTDLVLGEQKQLDGTLLDEENAISNLFGSGENPFVLVVPDFVLGTATRRWKVTNNTGNTIDVRLCFVIAYLDNGR